MELLLGIRISCSVVKRNIETRNDASISGSSVYFTFLSKRQPVKSATVDLRFRFSRMLHLRSRLRSLQHALICQGLQLFVLPPMAYGGNELLQYNPDCQLRFPDMTTDVSRIFGIAPLLSNDGIGPRCPRRRLKGSPNCDRPTIDDPAEATVRSRRTRSRLHGRDHMNSFPTRL